MKTHIDASLDSLFGPQNTVDPAGVLTRSAHGYEWQNWAGNRYWEGNESYFHPSDQVQTFDRDQTGNDIWYGGYKGNKNRDLEIFYKFQLNGDGDYSIQGVREYTPEGTVIIPLNFLAPIHYHHLGSSDDNTITIYDGENTVDLSAGGNNTVDIRGGLSTVIVGAGDDMVSISNDWRNPGHPGNWSSSKVDLSAGGNNVVEVSGNSNTSGLTIASITLGGGEDTVIARQASHVIIHGADSTGNHTIDLHGTQGSKGTVFTGRGETNLTAFQGDYDIHLGDGINSVDLSSWLGTSITVTFGSGTDTVVGHQHGMEFDLTGSNGGATLYLGAGQDQILIDDPSVSAPGLVYDFDFEQDSMTFGLDTDMMDLINADILEFGEFQVLNRNHVASLYNPEGYVLTQSDGTELFVDAGTVWSTFVVF